MSRWKILTNEEAWIRIPCHVSYPSSIEPSTEDLYIIHNTWSALLKTIMQFFRGSSMLSFSHRIKKRGIKTLSSMCLQRYLY
jgi:hypothetical protein